VFFDESDGSVDPEWAEWLVIIPDICEAALDIAVMPAQLTD